MLAIVFAQHAPIHASKQKKKNLHTHVLYTLTHTQQSIVAPLLLKSQKINGEVLP